MSQRPETTQWTFVTTKGLNLWQRIQVAASIALAPLTVILIGRAFTVTLPKEVPHD